MACDAAAAAIAGLPAPMFPNVYEIPGPDELNMLSAGELEVELDRFGTNESLATSLVRDDKTSVTGLLSMWLDTDD
uniref:Uncharacterized protein n=1 Tax=Arion vulgaris TaxID=1028688 RepID=A0A0B6Z2A8_9EUPU